MTLWVAAFAATLIYAGVAARAVAEGGPIAPWVIGVPLAYFGFVLLLTVVYFAVAWIFRAPRPPEVWLSPRQTLRLAWREYRALVGATPRMMLCKWLMHDPPPERVDAPVLLVHGVLCNAGVFHPLARFLRRCGVPGVYSLSYGPPLASIEHFADQLAAKIDAVLAETGASSVTIIAHSMGGLVARAYLRKHGHDKLRRVVSIGAPHHGSAHAGLFFGESLAQIRVGNPWLAALNGERIDPALPFVSMWSWHDSMVAPQTSSRLAGTIDVPLAGIGHNALLADPEVFARVLTEIETARGGQVSH